MKTLIIIARDSMIQELKTLLHDHGITAYSILHNVEGTGRTGTVSGTFFYPGINCIILAMISSDQADRAIHALQQLHAARAQTSHGQVAPLKVFSFPCEEHL